MPQLLVRRSRASRAATAHRGALLAAAAGVAVAALLARPAGAQRAPAPAALLVARADSLTRGGQLARAERLLYAAVRREPRDPEARLALGRYLAARGALKVGAVLMEEARFFGGDAREVAWELAPVYARLGDYKALHALPRTPLGDAQQARAAWLKANPPGIVGPDSAVVRFTPREGAALGVVRIVIGRDTLEATVEPAVEGLVLDRRWMRRSENRVFRNGALGERGAVGVTRAVRLGALTLTNVPTAYRRQAGTRRAQLGLDLFTRLAPTFDPARGRMTARRGGEADALRGERLPTLVTAGGVLVVGPRGAWPLASAEGRALLGTGRVTVDAARGVVIAER